MRIRELAASDEAFPRLYEVIFEPSFPPDELLSSSVLRERLEDGTGPILAAEDDDGTLLGGAVGEWDAESRIMLLTYLAIRPGLRGRGVGSALLTAALEAWNSEFGPCVVLAEVEDPEHFSGGIEAHGDPVARWRFYERHGGRVLDIPYFQAALRPDLRRVPHLMLTVLSLAPEFAGSAPDTVDPATLRTYLEGYQIACEGRIGTDSEAQAMWESLDRAEGVPFRAVSSVAAEV